MKVVAFDLDDTLYPEIEFVRSGFRAVAAEAARSWGVEAGAAFEALWSSLQADGRGRQLDALCARYQKPTRPWVRRFLDTYRRHAPDIELPATTRSVLEALSDLPLYLVTDGHKGVQANKVAALGLSSWFRHCYLTHRYGVRHEKPSTHVFRLMLKREGCVPGDVVYVGDDPTKDFRGIRPLGFRTIRVRQGRCAGLEVPPAQDAEITVPALSDVPEALRGLVAGAPGR